MQVEIVSVDRNARVLELNDDFHAVTFGTRGKVQQRMLVQAELREHTLETTRFRHIGIVTKAARASNLITETAATPLVTQRLNYLKIMPPRLREERGGLG
jgi:hypothetical protein